MGGGGGASPEVRHTPRPEQALQRTHSWLKVALSRVWNRLNAPPPNAMDFFSSLAEPVEPSQTVF